ncbi:MAG: SMC-Scp complex subunit ScpB [Rhodanobacter sp.]
MQIEQIKSIVEASLLASTQPMTLQQLESVFNEDDAVSREDVAKALEALGNDCAGRGVELKEVASGFRYQVRQEVHPWISRMWTERPSRYSRALLETLALIAYRQPITRPEIEQIRGVVVSSNMIKTMEEREWIRVVGYRDMPGKPALFGTTRAFLDYFNLKSLDQLPPLSDIRDMEDPQLRFDQTPLPARVERNLSIDPEGDAEAEAAALAEAAAAVSSIAPPVTDAEAATNNEMDGSDSSAESAAASNPHSLDDADSDHSSRTEPFTDTADEAVNPADVEPDTAEQDTEEYRA